MIEPTARIFDGVTIADPCRVEDFCLVGLRPQAKMPAEETTIGPDAVLRAFTVIYSGNHIGSGFRTGNKANIREGNAIGDDVSVGTMSVIEHHVQIGHRVRIHSQAFIPEYTIIEDDVWIGPNVVLTNARYPTSPGAKADLRGPILRTGCMIGANATILPAIEVGEGSLIGAGSVVTRDVPPGVISAGSPARILREIHY